ncbi:MAG: hypothetical protein MR902_09410 [Campylobacter sp.]|nr:hypothetical protein [Campylobacter sp.]
MIKKILLIAVFVINAFGLTFHDDNISDIKIIDPERIKNTTIFISVSGINDNSVTMKKLVKINSNIFSFDTNQKSVVLSSIKSGYDYLNLKSNKDSKIVNLDKTLFKNLL